MRKHYYFFLFILLLGCIEHSKQEAIVDSTSNDLDSIQVKYAEGFSVEYFEGYIKLKTKSISENDHFSDSLYIITDSKVELDEGLKAIGNADNTLSCQSSTYLAFLSVLNEIQSVRGLCGMQYVQSSEVKGILEENDVVEICLSEGVQLEALYESNADLFLVYPFGQDKGANYDEKGIKTLLIAEYLETSQLARLEWVKLFGLLTGKTKEANAYFEKVEKDYFDLKSQTSTLNKTFIMNLPFQDSWFMPSANSVGVELIEDAGLTYYYKDEIGTENILHSKETVWNNGIESDYWIIIARREVGFDMNDLLAEEEVYKEFKSVKDGHVIFCNTAEVDYFSQGVVEPNVILNDLLFATGQIEDYQPAYFFLLN